MRISKATAGKIKESLRSHSDGTTSGMGEWSAFTGGNSPAIIKVTGMHEGQIALMNAALEWEFQDGTVMIYNARDLEDLLVDGEFYLALLYEYDTDGNPIFMTVEGPFPEYVVITAAASSHEGLWEGRITTLVDGVWVAGDYVSVVELNDGVLEETFRYSAVRVGNVWVVDAPQLGVIVQQSGDSPISPVEHFVFDGDDFSVTDNLDGSVLIATVTPSITVTNGSLSPSYDGIHTIAFENSLTPTSYPFSLYEYTPGSILVTVSSTYPRIGGTLAHFRDLTISTTNGLSLTAGGGGYDYTIGLAAAGASQNGAMTTGTQLLSGTKRWLGFHEFDLGVLLYGSILSFQANPAGDPLMIRFNVNNGGSDPNWQATTGEFLDAGATGSRARPGIPILNHAANALGTSWRWNLGHGNSSGHYPATGSLSHGLVVETLWTGTNTYAGDKCIISGITPCFSVYDSASTTQYDGATTTVSGLVFKGGLYTSGSFSGGSGTVTTLSVASANGFAGTVATATTTPVITLSTTITGILKGNGTAISAATLGTDYGLGTVTSVAASVPSDLLAVSGSPITSSGTLAVTLPTRAANLVFAGPGTGSAATPTFRSLVAADIPNLAASIITSGTMATARLGSGTASSTTYLRGDQTWASTALDITGLTGVSPAMDDTVPIYDTSATSNKKTTVQKLLGLSRLSPGGRLVADSSSGSVTSADISSASSIWYIPHAHDQMYLWDGTDWMPYTIPSVGGTGWPLSVSLTGLNTTNKPYDMFAYVSSGAIALEYLVWSSTSVRATAVDINDGRVVKSGDKTRLYLGSFVATSSTTVADTVSRRFIWNYYNQVPRSLRYVDGNASWTYNTAAWRQANNNTAAKVEVCCGFDWSMVDLTLSSLTTNSAVATNWSAIGLDTTTAPNPSISMYIDTANIAQQGSTRYCAMPGNGYHYFSWNEYAGAGGGTHTFFGYSNGSYESGLKGWIMA